MLRTTHYLFTALLAASILSCQKSTDSLTGEEQINWVIPADNSVDSTIYYVSVNGSDKNSGLDSAHALKTIAQALSQVKPGGTIRILPGTYNESLGISGLGSTFAQTIITGWQGIPVLTGNQQLPIALVCEQCSGIVLRQMHVEGYTDAGLLITQSQNITIKELEVAENGHAAQLTDWELEGYGIHVDGSKQVVIRDNELYNNGPSPQIAPDRLMGTAINTYGNTDVQIINNRAHNNIGAGILVEDSYQVRIDSNELYENNLDATAANWWDGALWIDGGANISASYNQMHDNLGPGIQISDEDRQNPANYTLTGNLCTGNYYGIYIWNFGSTNWPACITRSNNHFSNNSRQNIWIVDWN